MCMTDINVHTHLTTRRKPRIARQTSYSCSGCYGYGWWAALNDTLRFDKFNVTQAASPIIVESDQLEGGIHQNLGSAPYS